METGPAILMNLTRFNYDSVDSTNLEARRFWRREDTRELARQAQGEGKKRAWVFVAREQASGRGRLGREWKSPAGGLWVSVLWPLATDAAHAQTVPLVAGLAVVDALERGEIPPCRIKWPNDVLINGRKVCGILCELEAGTEISAIIIGIGINVNFHVQALADSVSYPVTTLLDETGAVTDLEDILARVLEELCGKLLKFETEGLAPFLPFVNARLAWANSPVTMSGSEAGEVSGTLRGVDPQGRVLIDAAGLVLPLMTGDLRKKTSED